MSAAPGSFASAWLAAGGRFEGPCFPVPEPLRAGHDEAVRRGRKRMGELRAVLCGLARDEAGALPRSIPRIEALGEAFADHRFVIYENDSADDTPRILRDWARANPRVTAVSEVLGRPSIRTGRSDARSHALADARNHCQRIACERFGDFDVAVVLDTDLVGYHADGVAHSLGVGGWDAVGAKGLSFRDGGFVCPDVWAFRHPGQAGIDLGAIPDVHLFVPPRGAPLVPLASCFGGMAVYRMEAFAAGRYAGGDCEHVTFHASLREAGYGRFFLDPSLLALYPDFLELQPGWARRGADRPRPEPVPFPGAP